MYVVTACLFLQLQLIKFNFHFIFIEVDLIKCLTVEFGTINNNSSLAKNF